MVTQEQVGLKLAIKALWCVNKQSGKIKGDQDVAHFSFAISLMHHLVTDHYMACRRLLDSTHKLARN